MESGIYLITSPSGNQYVGSAANFEQRWRQHFSLLRRGRHHSPALQAAFNKYGEAAMVFSVLFRCQKEKLILCEQAAMDLLQPKYNINPTAGNWLGRKHNDLARVRMSLAKLGTKREPHSPETRAKIAASNKGKVRSAETIARIKATRPNMFSPDALKRIGEASKGRVKSDEAKAKVSAALKGRPKSAEHIAKVAAANTGKVRSAETRAKISAKLKGRKRDSSTQS